jgi:hypothetical protein
MNRLLSSPSFSSILTVLSIPEREEWNGGDRYKRGVKDLN